MGKESINNMRIYEQGNKEEIAEALTKMLEKDAGKKIFTMRIVGETQEGLEVIVIFEDKSVLMGIISVQTIQGKLAARIQANYI
jgi:L-amino acid N-acyltransferase YncA